MLAELILIALFAAAVSTFTLFSGFGPGTPLVPFLPGETAVAATAVVFLALLGLTAAAFAATRAAIGVDVVRFLVYGAAEIGAGPTGPALALTAAGIAGALAGHRILPKVTFRAAAASRACSSSPPVRL